MKLKDWADKQGISYLTAWRWFKAGDSRLTGSYQSDSGTIIVPDETTSESPMNTIQDSDIMAVVLKKALTFSKNNYPIEDFTAWVLSNFNLQLKGVVDAPKYSRSKPKSEEIQKHFQQFMKPKGEKPKPNMFVADADAFNELMSKADDLTAQELVEEIHKIGAEAGVSINPTDAPEVEELMKDLSYAIGAPPSCSNVRTYGASAEGVVMRSVDLTPQQINYTSYVNPASSTILLNDDVTGSTSNSILSNVSPSSFSLTQKEIKSANMATSPSPKLKSKRGRKPAKNKVPNE